MANASFGAADFDVIWDNPFTVPFPQPKREIVTRKVPYGARIIKQDLGKTESQGQYAVEMTQAEYAVLKLLAYTAATLDIDGDEVRANVFLADIQEPGQKDSTHDIVTLNLTFAMVV